MYNSGPGGQTVFVEKRQGPGCLVQALWFLFIGWWLGAAAISLAWFLNLTIIGLPLGMAILNRIPLVLALQTPDTEVRVTSFAGRTYVTEADQQQNPFLLRALFFLLIGWWWSGIWLGLAYILCATIILLPVGLAMCRLTPFMTSLARY